MSEVVPRESIWIGLDAALVRGLDALAKAKGITRHDAARLALRRGLEIAARSPAQTSLLPRTR